MKQGSAEWHAERAKRLTASDFGAALGLNPYCTPQKLWRIKCGLLVEPENVHMRRGTENEQKALFEYQVSTGLWADATGLVVHPAYDWLACSPDSTVGDDGLVEVKAPVRLRAEVPAYHYAQVQGQLEITGRQWCDYFQWTREGTSCIRVERDIDWWARALPVLTLFWGYVTSMQEPPRGACRITGG